MRKYTPLIVVLILVVSCSSEPKNNQAEKSVDTTTVAKDTAAQEQVKEKPDPTLPQYDSVVGMLEDAHDYEKDSGNLKVISSNPLHLQVSSWGYPNDASETLREGVMRDIVYVVFQAFAQTNIKSITVTAVPQNIENKGSYMDSYKETLTAERETAKKILEEYLKTSSFNDLFKYSDGIWLPNDDFAILRYDRLNSVYRELNQS